MSACAVPVLLLALFVPVPNAARAASFPNAGFEDGTLTGWSIGTQTGNLGASINGNGTGVTVFNGSRLFSHGSHSAMGSPTLSNGSPNPYYAPAVAAGTWKFSPKGGTYAVAVQPKSQQTFSQATASMGLSGTQTSAITTMLSNQASASGYGSGTPTDAAWITREVQLTAGFTYTMSWNYMATDYIPYNDGSITSLVPVTVTGTPVITVNNFVQSYALLGFTNPGTGDYSTNSYGSTGWQTSTYEVSISGTYKVGFVAFNLDDTALSPVLMVDDEIGTTLSCNQAGGSCVTFGGVEPNNETAPTIAPTTTSPATTTSTTSTTTSTTSTTTTTLPPAPTSLVVTSLDDTTSNGTLRWAITQANATAGGIYDNITFDVNGTITLTSALPQISQNVTITGNGRTNTIIDGNNAYRIFYVQSGKTLTVSDMTLKQGQSTNGGLIFNSQGTVTATNIRFTAMSAGSAVWNNNGGSTATYTNSTFDYLNNGIAGDYGSTPQLASGVTTWANEQDSVFANKTYVNNCIFDNNNAGIYNYRFTKVENSTFTNNSYAANITGLNRSQILNSTFDHNSIAIYHNAWIPTSFNMGTDNRLIDGNTFTNNNMAIYLDDGYNNNQKTPRWATVINNSFDENGVWITYYLWNGVSNISGNVGFNQPTELFVHSANISVATTTTTTTTTTSTTTTSTTIPSSTTSSSVPAYPPVIEVPTGTSLPETPITTIPVTPLPETPTSGEIDPTPSPEVITTIPDSLPDYTVPTDEPVVIPDMPDAGKPIATKDLTDILDTTFTPDASTEEITAVLDGLLDTKLTGKQFDAVVDATLGSLDESGADVGAVLDSFLGADLSDKEFTKVLDAVFSADVSDAVFVEALTTMLSADISDAEFAKVLNSAFSADASPEAMVSALGAILDGPTSAGDVAKIMDAVFDEDISVADAGAVLGDLLSGDLTGESLAAVFDSVFDGDLSDSDTVDLAETIFAEPLSVEEFNTVINAIFDEKVSDEILVGTFEAVLSTELSVEKFAEVVNVLENANITNDQVSQVVDLIVSQDGGVSGEQATELATSPKVLESIDGEQATAVFDAIVVAEVSQEAGAQIAEALAGAATDVKESFEEQINVFAGVFDTYVALGSQINVGDRRTVIAVAAVAAVAGAASAMGGGSGSSPSSGGSGAPTRGSDAYRKDEEEEASGEIAGDGVEWIKQLSIFRYNNGVKILDWGLFMKKFIYGVMNLGFTISGCLVVYLTLSGSLQRIAGVSSVVALLCALYLHMQEPDNN